MLVQLFILKKAEIIIYYENNSYFNYFLVEEKNKTLKPYILTLNITNINPIDYFLIFSLKYQQVLVVDTYNLSVELQNLNFKIDQEEDIQKSLKSLTTINKNYILHTLPRSLNTKTIPFSKFFKLPLYNKIKRDKNV